MCKEPIEVRSVLTAQGKQYIHALSATPTRDAEEVWSDHPRDNSTAENLQMIRALI